MARLTTTTTRLTNLAQQKEKERLEQLEKHVALLRDQNKVLKDETKKLVRGQEALFVALATVAFVAILAVCVALWKVVG